MYSGHTANKLHNRAFICYTALEFFTNDIQEVLIVKSLTAKSESYGKSLIRAKLQNQNRDYLTCLQVRSTHYCHLFFFQSDLFFSYVFSSVKEYKIST